MKLIDQIPKFNEYKETHSLECKVNDFLSAVIVIGILVFASTF